MSEEHVSEKELISLMRLMRTPGIGEITLFSLLEIYKNAENVLGNLSSLYNNLGKIIDITSESEVLKELDSVKRFGAKIITYKSKTYSKLLAQIKDCPPLLTVKGNLELLNKKSIAIVGARVASLNSCKFTYGLAKELAAQHDFNVVSGLAAGVDTAAHKIVYDNLPTVAVIATGINEIYPKESAALHKMIEENGLLISELPIGVKAKPQHFARRNRIIAGLSSGVVLTEAGLHSGSLITAECAANYGRNLFAVPGSPFDGRFAGTNFLLKRGATLVECVQDIIEKLNEAPTMFEYPSFLKGSMNKKNPKNRQDAISTADERMIENFDKISLKEKILQLLDHSPIDKNLLLINLDVPHNFAIAAMSELELENKIARHIGNCVSLIH